MIRLHKLNGQEVIVNAELIESVEAHPDTVIALASNNRFVVKESVTDVIQRVIEYRKTVYVGASYLPEFLRRDEMKPKAHHAEVGGPSDVRRRGQRI